MTLSSPKIALSVVDLPAPFGPDDDADIGLLDGEVDAVEDGRAAIAADHVLDFEQGHQAASTGEPK